VDPEAPQGLPYRQLEFEHCDLPPGLDAVVACTSPHHVADLGQVLDLTLPEIIRLRIPRRPAPTTSRSPGRDAISSRIRLA
jgi:hypothetical protein